MKGRGTWQGMWTIVRFNWPFYGGALATIVLASVGFWVIEQPEMKVFLGTILLASLYFLVVSLSVSHQVYDRSDLYRWEWLTRVLDRVEAKNLVFCHSGFDEASPALRERYSFASWVVLDHYDSSLMTEASIRRARKRYPPTEDTQATPYNSWHLDSESVDVIFGLLAIHELRSEVERSAWFSEAKRCLRPGGRVVIAEHVRDFANFVAFGPGFLHFHSKASWQKCWDLAGLQSTDEFTITPWVRIFVISKP